MRRFALAALLAAGLAAPILPAAFAQDADPGVQSAEDSFYASVRVGKNRDRDWFYIRATVNTMGKVDCSKKIDVVIHVDKRSRFENWSVDPAICPESSYTIKTVRDLNAQSSYESPAQFTVKYPALSSNGKDDKGSKGSKDSKKTPMILTVEQYRFDYDDDSCSNVGVIGKSVTCDTEIFAGKG